MESIWGRQDPGGPHAGPMNFAIWGVTSTCSCEIQALPFDFSMEIKHFMIFWPDQFWEEVTRYVENNTAIFSLVSDKGTKNSNNWATKIGNPHKQIYRRLRIWPQSTHAIISL